MLKLGLNEDINNSRKGGFWRAISIIFICIDLLIIFYQIKEFIRTFRLLSTLSEEINSKSVPPVNYNLVSESVTKDFIIKIAISIIITGVTIICIIKRRYRLASIISGIPILLLIAYIAVLLYAFRQG
jgi:hypothetical protein